MSNVVEPTIEERANDLCDQLKEQIQAISVDSANLKRVIKFMNELKDKGYPVGDSVAKLETQKSTIETDLTEVSTVMEEKSASLKALADALADDLPTF